MTLTTMTLAEYRVGQRRFDAGPVADVCAPELVEKWKADAAGWRGRYWVLIETDGVHRLGPLNVTR